MPGSFLASRGGPVLESAEVLESLKHTWTNDPFDRLIVAQASANHGAMLITKDRLIRQKYANAVW